MLKIKSKYKKLLHTKYGQRIKIHNSMSNVKTENKYKLCQQTKKILNSLMPKKILIIYTKYLSSLIKNFITNNNDILNTIFTIKKKLQQNTNQEKYKLTLSNTLRPIPTHLQIPQILDIIKYLFTLTNFTKYFNDVEINSINTLLQTNNSLLYISNTNKHKIYDYLHNNTIGCKIIDIYYKEYNTLNVDTKFPSLQFHNLLLNSFTSYKILEDIEKNINTLYIGSLTYNNQNTSGNTPIQHGNDGNEVSKPILYIYNTENIRGKVSMQNNIHRLGNQITERLLFFNEILNTDRLPTKLIIFLTKHKKEITKELEHTQHFKTININTAVTDGRDIIIYRKQEVLKSVFHELIHFHTLDFRNIPQDVETKILNYLKSTHNISDDNKYVLYECVTETLANILNNIYSINSKLTHSNSTIHNNTYKHLQSFSKNFVDEIIFSTFQVAKILKICKYTSWNEFVLLETPYKLQHNQQTKHIHNTTTQFKQDSCVFSYYILKLYILLNIDTYFNTILDKQLKFNPTPDNFNKLIDIFEKGRNDKYLASMINAILKKSKKTNNNNNNNKSSIRNHNKSSIRNHNKSIHKNNIIINKTLRMTCI